MKYKVMLYEQGVGRIVATVPMLPGCVWEDSTKEKVMERAKMAIEARLRAWCPSAEVVPLGEDSTPAEVALRLKEGKRWMAGFVCC